MHINAHKSTKALSSVALPMKWERGYPCHELDAALGKVAVNNRERHFVADGMKLMIQTKYSRRQSQGGFASVCGSHEMKAVLYHSQKHTALHLLGGQKACMHASKYVCLMLALYWDA